MGCQFRRALLACCVALAAVLGSGTLVPVAAVEPDGPALYPMTMPVTGMVESLVGGGCPSARSHSGIDISSDLGTAAEIDAAFPGTAYAIDGGDGYGLRVDIVHPFDGGAYVTRYAHLSQALVPATGIAVDQGDVIGMMGSSGNAQIVHLHFEVRRVVGTTDEYLDLNPAFRPCRRDVVAGDPIPIEFAPLVPPLNGILGLDGILGMDGPYLELDLSAVLSQVRAPIIAW